MSENVLQIPLSSEITVAVSEDRNIAVVNGQMVDATNYTKLSKQIMAALGFEPPKRKPRKKADAPKADGDLNLE